MKMKNEEIQNLKDKAFKARSESEWNDVMQAIKVAVAADENAANLMRNYCKSLLPKKKEFWAKYPAKKPAFRPQAKTMFSTDTDEAIEGMCDAIRIYFDNLITIQVAQNPNVKGLHLNNGTY